MFFFFSSSIMFVISDLLLMLKSFLLVVIFLTDVMPSIAACKSVQSVTKLSDGIARITDRIASNSVLIDEGQLDIESTYLISSGSGRIQLKPIFVFSLFLALCNDPSENMIKLLSVVIPMLKSFLIFNNHLFIYKKKEFVLLLVMK